MNVNILDFGAVADGVTVLQRQYRKPLMKYTKMVVAGCVFPAGFLSAELYALKAM